MSARATLNQRLHKRPGSWLDIRSDLWHFALINYAVPTSRLEHLLPVERFEIAEFMVDGEPEVASGRPQAMLSVVPFVDADFHFYRLAPWLKFRFAQTNHRIYVIDRLTGEPVVWFLGTTLGSRLVHLARQWWGIPWHHGHYQVRCEYDTAVQKYSHYSMQIASPWCAAQIEIEDTGQPTTLTDEERLILTHPVEGFYYQRDGRIGGYSIWHPEIPLTKGIARHLYFSLYERLGIMNREEMQHPHSIYLCPSILFEIHMPPGEKG
jgi:hypothetical protein